MILFIPEKKREFWEFGKWGDVWEKFPNNTVFFLRAYLRCNKFLPELMITIVAEEKRKKHLDSDDGRGNVSASPTDRQCAKNEIKKIQKLKFNPLVFSH